MKREDAAEEHGRTEAPTAARLRGARAEGMVARTPELPAALMLLCAVAALVLFGRSALAAALEMLRHYFLSAGTPELATALGAGPLALSYLLRLALPLALVGFVAAVCGNLFQVGLRFAARPLVPDPGRLVPQFGSFFRRGLLSAEALVNLAKVTAKVVVIAAITFVVIRVELERLAAGIRLPLAADLSLVASAALRIAGVTALALLVLAVPDYLLQRRAHRRALQMTPREVREERRRQEVDPQVRRRLRHRMRELLSRDLEQQVAGATAVISDQAGCAVAVRWSRHTMPAPTVVATGTDRAADRIRAVAAANRIALVDSPQLARALAAYVAVGDPIPAAYYRLVAAALAGVGVGGDE